MSEVTQQKSLFDIQLSFPLATFKKYRLSYTEACLSEFIKNVLSCDYEEDDIKKLHTPTTFDIEVPKELYANMRENDLDVYISLWNGKCCYYPTVAPDNNSNAMAQFSRALCMNEDLYFVKKFIEAYPDNFSYAS